MWGIIHLLFSPLSSRVTYYKQQKHAMLQQLITSYFKTQDPFYQPILISDV